MPISEDEQATITCTEVEISVSWNEADVADTRCNMNFHVLLPGSDILHNYTQGGTFDSYVTSVQFGFLLLSVDLIWES